MTDDEISRMDMETLREEVRRLRSGIREHRDQRGDDRCWLDDEKLYELMPEGIPACTVLDPELMMPNCQRFMSLRVHPRDRFSWGNSPGGSMLPVLEQAELELPSLLLARDSWQSLLVNDEHPNVERLWMPYGAGRLCLHLIHLCGEGESLYHPHPWPSAMRILYGKYETAYGHGSPMDAPPPRGATRTHGAGDRYEMVNPLAWHCVRPIGEPVLSVMVTGKPWASPGLRKGRSLAPLSDARISEMLYMFRSYFPSKTSR